MTNKPKGVSRATIMGLTVVLEWAINKTFWRSQ